MRRRLGILVLVLLAAPAVRAVLAEEAEAPRVSLEIAPPNAGGPSAASLTRVREQLVARLVEEGFAVVPASGRADIVLRLANRPRGWLVSASLPTEALEREVGECHVERAEERLELVQKATELARKAHLRARQLTARKPSAAEAPPLPAAPALAAAAPPAAAPLPPAARPPLAQAPPPAPPLDSSTTSPATVVAVAEEVQPPDEGRGVPMSGLSIGVDLLAREGHASPVWRVGGRIDLRDDFGLVLAVGVANPYSVFYRLFEEQAVIGVGYRVVPFARVWLDTTATVGVLVQEYRVQGGSGWAKVPEKLAMVTFSGGVALARHVGVELRVSPAAHTANAHPDVAESWSTSKLLLQAGVGIVVY